MKLVVVGFGQCGGYIADEFARLNKRARRQRRINIILDALAVDSDAAALAGLSTVKSDYQHRVLIGGSRMKGAGVNGDSGLATEIAGNETYRIINALRASRRFTERDAILLVAGTAGGVGSASLPVVAEMIKQLYLDRPVYSLLILPSEPERAIRTTIYQNTETCLKLAYTFSDAVILVDNERFVQKDSSLKNDFYRINQMIVEPFYNLFCAGEEKKARYIGSRPIDAGEIMQILSGWTAIGCGRSPLPLIKFPFGGAHNFRKVSLQPNRGMEAMDEALAELSVRCTVRNAGRALYLLSAPTRVTSVQLIADLDQYLRQLVPDAELRSGDYPRERGVIEAVVILSQLKDIDKVRMYYARSAAAGKGTARRKQSTSKRDKVNRAVPGDTLNPDDS